MASALYNSFKSGLMNGTFDLNADVIKIALMTANYVFDASDVNWTDSGVSVYEVDVVNYSKATMTTSVELSGSSSNFKTAGDIVWNNITITNGLPTTGAIIYDSSVVNSPLIAWIDFNGSQTCANATFTISWTNNIITSLT